MIALTTAAGADDEDLLPLTRACGEVGLECVATVWDDPCVEWSKFDLAVVRSTWDYAANRDAFLTWAERTSRLTPVYNPPEVLAWNTDKRYLAEVAAEGLPVVPTEFVEPGGGYSLPTDEFVVKPIISAGSKDTIRYAAGDYAPAHAHIDALASAGRGVMIQPYQSAIEESGERALVFIDGEFSHAATKAALLDVGVQPAGPDEMFAVEDMTPATPSVRELDVANEAMQWISDLFETLLYARVDVVDDDLGNPQILEIELAEPSLFHRCGPGSAERFAAAISRRLGS